MTSTHKKKLLKETLNMAKFYPYFIWTDSVKRTFSILPEMQKDKEYEVS